MRRLLLCAALIGAGCSGPRKLTLDELSNGVQVDSLPAGALVALDGHPAGRAPTGVDLPAGRTVTLTIALQGFTPRTLTGSRAQLLGGGDRLGVVLTPEGWRPPRPLDMNEPKGLGALARELERRRDWGHAAEAWARLLELSPRDARAHRGMGSCFAKMGRDEQAIREYEQYLFLAPDAPDAARVRHAVDSYRGGIDLPSSAPP